MLLLTFVLFNLLVFAQSRVPCAQRNVGKPNDPRLVCVCNATYCDTLDPWKKTAAGVVTVFETNKDGDRLKETQLKFEQTVTGNANVAQTVTIDRNKKAQRIIGFGASMTDSTGYNIRALNDAAQQHLIDGYFSTNGLEFNLIRVPIGGTDFSIHPYSYDDNHKDDFNLDHFNLTVDDHSYKIRYIKMADKVSPYKIKYFGSPWAPPAWMKDNNELVYGGYLIGKPGEKYYKTFAKYFVKFLDAYKANGIDMWGITIENEPGAGDAKSYSFNSLGFTPELQRDFIKLDLGPTLEAAGYGKDKLDVMIFDHNRNKIYEWASTIYKDKEAAKYVHGTAVHWYDDPHVNATELDKAYAVDPSKYILNTEASNCCRGIGNWINAQEYARLIIEDLNHQVAGYVAWNMVLDRNGGPRWNGGAADAPVAVDHGPQEFLRHPSFYALGHFSKFLVPDSVKIGITEDKKVNNVFSTAFERPDGGVVVIVFNQGGDTVQFTIKEDDNHVTHTLKPNTIQTYIYYD